jgi:predicted nucleic acid-binding protein
MSAPQRVLADTSIFVGLEAARIDVSAMASYVIAVSVMTLGELQFGVFRPQGPQQLAVRSATFDKARSAELLPITPEVASAWALLQAQLALEKRKMLTNDSWIAATAIAHRIPVLTQDADYEKMPGLAVIRL